MLAGPWARCIALVLCLLGFAGIGVGVHLEAAGYTLVVGKARHPAEGGDATVILDAINFGIVGPVQEISGERGSIAYEFFSEVCQLVERCHVGT